MNRDAVREAVKRQAQAGLVASQHGSGHHVPDFRRSAGLDLLPKLLFKSDGDVDLQVVRSVMEMRAAVGPDAAALCAKRASQGLLTNLRACVTEMQLIELAVAKIEADATAALQGLAVIF